MPGKCDRPPEAISTILASVGRTLEEAVKVQRNAKAMIDHLRRENTELRAQLHVMSSLGYVPKEKRS